MGEHIDNRSPRRNKTRDSEDVLARKRRVTFKNYIREIQEEEMLEDAEDDDDLETE